MKINDCCCSEERQSSLKYEENDSNVFIDEDKLDVFSENYCKFSFLIDNVREINGFSKEEMISKLRNILDKCETLNDLRDLHQFFLLCVRCGPSITEYLISEKHTDVYRKG